MKHITAGLAAVLMAFITVTFGVNAQEQAADTTEPTGQYDGLESFVDGLVDGHFKTTEITGATISIVKDGELVFAKGYGWQDIDKRIKTDAATSTFRIGSTSKLFTWTAVMQQVEQGKLDLDTDVNQYLTQFQIPDTYDAPITLRHIMTHTAGFEDGGLGYLINYEMDQTLPMEEALEKYMPARINPPGAYSSYSNYATALAGLIVQNVSGTPFNDYVTDHILKPLGMHNSTFAEPLPEALEAGRTIGYKRDMGVLNALPFELVTGMAPAGSMSSTATDMAKFMIAHIDNANGLLRPETAQLMHSTAFETDARIGGMALGFYEEHINGHRLIGHGGDTMQFHTNMLIDKTEKLGIFVSYATPSGAKGRDTFIQSFYDRYYPVEEKVLTPPEGFDERAGKYAGEYRFWRHNESTLEKAFGVLGPNLVVSPTGKGTLLVAGVIPPEQFVEIDANLFQQVGGNRVISFKEDADGNIQDLNIAGLPFMATSRAPVFETSLYKQTLPIVSYVIIFTVILGWIYRRKEFKTMERGERTAIRFSLGLAVSQLGFLLMIGYVFTAHGDTLFHTIPTALYVALVFPILAVVLSFGVAYQAVQAWREGYWRVGRRIHYSLVALAGLFLSVFYYYWNILGFQIAA